MLIDNAEQFGLAQLHQLRGRVGRGAHDSYCILLAGAKSKDAQERLKVLEETSDGFRIAEADLEARGPGGVAGPAAERRRQVPVWGAVAGLGTPPAGPGDGSKAAGLMD